MYKLFRLGFFLFWLSGNILAQSSAVHQVGLGPQILRFSWSPFQRGTVDKQPGMLDYNAGKSTETFRNEQQQDMRPQTSATVQSRRETAMLEAQKQKIQQAGLAAYPNQHPTSESRYKYQLELKNTAPQRIVELSWDYVFLDAQGQQEILRHHFVSRVKIKPAGKARVTAYTALAPPGLVNAKAASKNTSERVILQQVVYADGSVWNAH